MPSGTYPKVGLVASIGNTIDAFFGPIIERWIGRGLAVETAAGTPASITSVDHHLIDGLSRTPNVRNVSAVRAFRDWCRDSSIDVVVTNTAMASTLVRASKLDRPVIYFCHGLHWNEADWRSAPFRLVERALARRTDAVITINSDDYQWFRSIAPRIPHLRLVHGIGLDTDRFRRTYQPSTHAQKSLLWIGEFTERKNPLAAIETLRQLRRQGVHTRLTMLGEGRLLEATRTAANSAQLDVRFPGRQDPVAFLASADVMLHTASWEGLPRVLLEAAAVGVPIAAFDVKGVRDVPSVKLAPRGDIPALADAVCSALAAPATAVDPDRLRYEHAADALYDFIVAVYRRELNPGELWTR